MATDMVTVVLKKIRRGVIDLLVFQLYLIAHNCNSGLAFIKKSSKPECQLVDCKKKVKEAPFEALRAKGQKLTVAVNYPELNTQILITS